MFPMSRAERPILSVCMKQIFEILRRREKNTKKVEASMVNDGSMTVVYSRQPPNFPFTPLRRHLLHIPPNIIRWELIGNDVKLWDAFNDT